MGQRAAGGGCAIGRVKNSYSYLYLYSILFNSIQFNHPNASSLAAESARCVTSRKGYNEKEVSDSNEIFV